MSDFQSEFAREIAAMHEDFARAVNRQFIPGGPPIAPPSRWERFRWSVAARMRDGRERVARKIAPWLDEGY